MVLGRPGAGCSTLLKVLANQREDYHAVEGTIYYDAMTPHEIEKHYRGDVQYCPEDDRHFPMLTVRQTLTFSAKTRAPRQRVAGHDRPSFVGFITDITMTLFGLMRVANTPVGDQAIRGVSGGEKKRVSYEDPIFEAQLANYGTESPRVLIPEVCYIHGISKILALL